MSMLFSMLLLLLASDNSRASLSLAIPVTSSDSLILVLIFLVVVEAVAEEAIEAVGNGGNFGGCKVALTVEVVLTTPWLILLISEDEVDAAAEAEILQG